MRGLAVAFVTASAFAQPPVGPDPRPDPISPEALNDAIGGPSLVTLRFNDARPEEVVRALVQQVGIALDSYASTDLLKKMPPMSVSVVEQPFTVALATVTAQLGVWFTLKNPTGFDNPPSGMTLQLQKNEDPQMQMAGPMLQRGPFLVIATAVERKRTAAVIDRRAGDQRRVSKDEATVDFVILGDPKLRQHFAYGAPKFGETAGWKIRSAETESPWDARVRNQGLPFLEWRYRATCELSGDLRESTPPLQATASDLLVATAIEKWVIEDAVEARGLARELPLAKGSRRYEVKEIAAAAARGGAGQHAYDVRLVLSGSGIDKGTWSGWPPLPAGTVLDSFRLLDADGRDYAPLSWEMKGGAFTAQFSNSRARGGGQPATGKATRAEWTLTKELRMVEIPIEFPALPLP